MQFVSDRGNLVVVVVGGKRPAATAASGLPAWPGRVCLGVRFDNVCTSPVPVNVEWLGLEAAHLYKTAVFPCRASFCDFYPNQPEQLLV